MADVVMPKDAKGRFLPGNNGGPGRPQGARAKLGEAFVEALKTTWEAGGMAALERVRDEDPTAYVRVVANLLPKEVDVSGALSLGDMLQQVRETYGGSDA